MDKLNIVIILLAIASGEGLPLDKIYRQHENKEGMWNCYNEVCHEDKAPHATKHLSIPNTQEELAGILNRQVKETVHSSEEFYDSELAIKYDEILVETQIRFRRHNGGYHNTDNANDFDEISDNYVDHKISVSNFDDDGDVHDNEFWDEEEDDDFIGYKDQYKTNNEISFARDDGENNDDQNDDDDDGEMYILLMINSHDHDH